MRSLWVVGALAAGAALFAPGALGQSQPGAVEWLRKIYAATERLSYTGTFVYQHGERVETSRLTRLVDASGVYERLETLDGTPREVIRVNDEVQCYIPSTMTLKVDRQLETRPFPAMRADVGELAQVYTVRKAEVERIAGFDCQAIVLEPKDKLRYGHKLWADLDTGMLIKARTIDEKGETVEQFAFTELKIGGKIDREKVKSRFAGKGRDWRVERSGIVETDLGAQGWSVGALPAGYRKVAEVKRSVAGAREVGQIVVSDGLAAVSVFVEPLAGKGTGQPFGPARQGAVNLYTRQVEEFLVTVVGEVPAESVRQIAHNVEYRRPR